MIHVSNYHQGIGLFLCKNLVELMDGEISLDDDFDSGMPGCPGSRFVINLKSPRIEHHPTHHPTAPHHRRAISSDAASCDGSYFSSEATEGSATKLPEHSETTGSTAYNSSTSGGGFTEASEDAEALLLSTPPSSPAEMSDLQDLLPETCSVLLVDDDAIIRKMLARAIRNVAPGWTFREAASGEAALRLLEESDDKAHPFDLCFVDMYMASVEKQLLGTETVVEMRHRGIQSTICGLSANDKEFEFLQAGADAFLLKPFPCDRVQLTHELLRILNPNKKVDPIKSVTWAYAR